MSHGIRRRDFLIAAPAAVGVLAGAAHGAVPADPARRPSVAARIPRAVYAPGEYPIRGKRYSEVTLRDTFWKPKVDRNAQVTIPFEVQKRAGSERELSGNVLEAAILSLQTHPDPALQAHVAERIQAMASQPMNGNRGFEVAATWYHATGRRELIDRAIASAAALHENFRLNDPPFSGGERDAVNCLALYGVTGDRMHLDLAKHYLDIRGRPDSVGRSRHNQSHKHVLEQYDAVGHAVNCVTLMVSMLDVGILSGTPGYAEAAQRMWNDVITGKMYVTGGVGTTGNEGFGEPFSLPNISAYSETCAVLYFITLNHRLFLSTGDSRYIDVMERGMYNNAIDGVSVSGDHYFYVNRLASAGDGRDHRWQHASLECCPPNLVRFLARMPGYVYAQDAGGAVYVNLYVSSDASFTVNGAPLALSVDSELPWAGGSTIKVAADREVNGTVKLRIPGWAVNRPVPGQLYSYADRVAAGPRIAVNGREVPAATDALGYVSLDRTWRNGDVITLEFPVEVRRVVADERVQETRRRVAIERGPIVYCAEWPDVEGGRALNLLLEPDAPLEPVVDGRVDRDVVAIDTRAGDVCDPVSPARPVRLIPYHLWANRGAGEMSVWLPVEPYAPGDVGPAGGHIFYVNPNYATDGWRYLEAAPWDQSMGAQWGCFRRLIPGARGTAIGTGKQNTADMLAACAEPGTAAHLCANLSVNGVGGWFLPSRDELVEMYRVLRATNIGDFRDQGLTDNASYWASSQNTADMAAHVDFPDLGRVHGDDKDFPRRVRAIRAF